MIMRAIYCVLSVAVALALAWSLSAQDSEKKPAAPAESPLKTVEQKVGYAIGQNISASLKRQNLDVDIAALARGIADGMAGRESLLSDKERDDAFAAMEQKQALRTEEKSRLNLEAGRKFLATNGKKKGIKTTESGLQYEVLRAGKGATPKPTDTVETHYKGRLLDGAVFDGSYEGDEPTKDDDTVSFGVTQVIKGWTEALQLMRVGDKLRLYIPSELAYGERGTGKDIGPNSVLVFDIELIGIK
jgi:FKBP-type peptidyl-prolyl cis-trans isomerase FklB